MALTLVVEDGSIVTGANAYLDATEADAILEVDFRLWPIWNALTADEKAQRLIMSTRFLDKNFIWFGLRVQPADPDATPPVVAQPLQWPRKGMRDCEGNCIPETLIPDDLKEAVAYFAVWLHGNDPDEAFDQAGIKRFRNDTVEIEWQDNFSGQSGFPAFLTRLLQCFGTAPGERGFRPIIRK